MSKTCYNENTSEKYKLWNCAWDTGLFRWVKKKKLLYSNRKLLSVVQWLSQSRGWGSRRIITFMLFDYSKDRRIQCMVLKASYIIQLKKKKKTPHNPDFERK